MSKQIRSTKSLKDRFVLGIKLGSGTFGDVFEGTDQKTGDKTAIKQEMQATGKGPQLQYEMQVIKLLNGSIGFPKLYGFWSDAGYNFMAMSRLGPNLSVLLERCRGRFSVKTVLMIADQILSRLQFLHECHYVHRDIKPENFTIGVDKCANTICMIDFGLSKMYRDAHTHIHIPERSQRTLTGTVRYASINNHIGTELTRRDDLESVSYMLFYFLRGNLPWQGIKSHSKQRRIQKIQDKKRKTTSEKLCAGYPPEFGIFMDKVRSLQFDERPKYEEYREMFRSVMVRMGYVFDYVYDWDKEPEDGELLPEQQVPIVPVKMRASKPAVIKKPEIKHLSHKSRKPLWMQATLYI